MKVRIEDEDRSVRIPFANPEHASIAKRVIEVDSELQAHLVKRSLDVEDCELIGCVPSNLICLPGHPLYFEREDTRLMR